MFVLSRVWIGLIMVYGKVRWILLLLLFSLMWKCDIIIVLVGLMMLVNCGLILELRYLNFSGSIGV